MELRCKVSKISRQILCCLHCSILSWSRTANTVAQHPSLMHDVSEWALVSQLRRPWKNSAFHLFVMPVQPEQIIRIDPWFGLITLPVWVDDIGETRSCFQVNRSFEWILGLDWSLPVCESTRLARPNLALKWTNDSNRSFFLTDHSPCVSRRGWRDPIWLWSEQMIGIDPSFWLITLPVWVTEIGETRSGFEVSKWFEWILPLD